MIVFTIPTRVLQPRIDLKGFLESVHDVRDQFDPPDNSGHGIIMASSIPSPGSLSSTPFQVKGESSIPVMGFKSLAFPAHQEQE
jgi:hypothetical protein